MNTFNDNPSTKRLLDLTQRPFCKMCDKTIHKQIQKVIKTRENSCSRVKVSPITILP